MEFLNKSLESLPNWSANELNRWADFIELLCIKCSDKIFSIHDILDFYSDERADELERGKPNHADEFDKLMSNFEQCFDLLHFRYKTLQDYYPFEFVDEMCIQVKEEITEDHLFYFFLVLASNLSLLKKGTSQALALAFEDICSGVLKVISSPFAETLVFGTSRTKSSPFKGNLKERICQLAKEICTQTTKSFDEDTSFNVSGGDGGVDIVSYFQVDQMPFIPVSFAQCTCSFDIWENKQYSIHYDKWRNRFENIAPYLQFMFVPFYYRTASGEFENKSRIITCLFDRHRIFAIYRKDRFIRDMFVSHDIYRKVIRLYKSISNSTTRVSA